MVAVAPLTVTPAAVTAVVFIMVPSIVFFKTISPALPFWIFSLKVIIKFPLSAMPVELLAGFNVLTRGAVTSPPLN